MPSPLEGEGRVRGKKLACSPSSHPSPVKGEGEKQCNWSFNGKRKINSSPLGCLPESLGVMRGLMAPFHPPLCLFSPELRDSFLLPFPCLLAPHPSLVEGI